jgi:hypothetical protein
MHHGMMWPDTRSTSTKKWARHPDCLVDPVAAYLTPYLCRPTGNNLVIEEEGDDIFLCIIVVMI